MTKTRIQIPMHDGAADAYVSSPAGAGPWPAVLLFMDALGWRPTLFTMADRLAAHGYYVVVPNMLWRAGPYPPVDPKTVFGDEQERARLMKILATVTDEGAMRDVESLLEFLAGQPEVKDANRVACTGYCMGGGIAIRAACTFPDRIAAAASFHGARFLLSSEAPDLIAKHLQARVYIGVAETDHHHTPEITARLSAAFEAAKVPYTIETYPGASHGFAVSDTPAYTREAGEQHWDRLLKLLRETFA